MAEWIWHRQICFWYVLPEVYAAPVVFTCPCQALFLKGLPVEWVQPLQSIWRNRPCSLSPLIHVAPHQQHRAQGDSSLSYCCMCAALNVSGCGCICHLNVPKRACRQCLSWNAPLNLYIHMRHVLFTVFSTLSLYFYISQIYIFQQNQQKMLCFSG